MIHIPKFYPMDKSKTYLITYDLSEKGQRYPELITEIELLGEHCHCLLSVWIVKTSLTAFDILNRLSKHIDSNDKLFVARLTSPEVMFTGIDKKDEKWLKKNMPQSTME